MLTLALALAMMQDICPVTLGVGSDGSLFSNRFRGWYTVSARTIQSDLRGGCYNDANSHPVTSVKVELAPKAPKAKVEQVFSILKKEGWGQEKVKVESWDDYPRPPK